MNFPRRTDALAVLVALDLAGFGMVVSDIQFRLEGMRLPGWGIGAVLSSMFVVQFPASAWWGRVADRIGPQRVLVLCTLLSAISMLVYGVARDPWMILASRMIAGAGAANVAMAYAIASRVASSEERPRLVGRLSAATVLGLSAGTALGGFIVNHQGQTALGLTGCLLSVLAAAIGFLAVPRPEPTGPSAETKKGNPFARYAGTLGVLMVVATVGWLSLATLEGTFGRLIKATLGFSQREFGIVFGFESLVAFVAQAFAFERLSRQVAPRTILAAAFFFTGVGLLAMPFAPSMAWLLGAAAIYAAGSGLATPSLNELVAQNASEERRGEVYGTIQSLRSVGFIVGPIVGGRLFDAGPALPYVLAAAICTAVAFYAYRALGREPVADLGSA